MWFVFIQIIEVLLISNTTFIIFVEMWRIKIDMLLS